MLITQKQQIESYQRVQDFLKAHPPPESPGYLVQKKKFDDIVATLTNHSSGQAEGRRLRRAAVSRQPALRKALRDQHLAPIAQIARALLADAPGIEKALRMPAYNLNPLRFIAEANAMRSAAAPYEAQFIEAGRPADFLAQLDAATEALRQSILGKARNLGQQVGARAGLASEIKRGRRLVDVLDTIVKAAFLDDADVLAEWRSAKRIRGVPSGANGRNEGTNESTNAGGAAGTPIAAPVAAVTGV
jgi:hypothetical protein